MREQKALLLFLALHRDRCRKGCPPTGARDVDVIRFCPEGLKLIRQLIESEDDA